MKQTLAGLYLRISQEDDREREESNSISNQRMITSDFAKNHSFEIIDEYIDDGYTGTNFERPGWKRLLDDCKKERINCVIVKDFSRLGRNSLECGRFIETLFPAWGIRLIAVADLYDSDQVNEPGAEMTIAFKNLMNDFYCRDISIKVRTALRTRMQRGQFVGGFVPYGYKKDPDKKGHLLIDDEEAEVIRTIFRLKMDGMNPKAIARYLDLQEIPSPAVRIGLAEESEWNTESIRNILKNEIYLGRLAQGKYRKKSYKGKEIIEVPKEEWIRVNDTHEAIIGWNTFMFVQDLMSMDTNTANGEERLSLISGFIRCGDCGQNLIRYKSAGRGYYHCSAYVRREYECRSHCISEEKLIHAVTLAVHRHTLILQKLVQDMEEKDLIPSGKARLRKLDEKIKDKTDFIAECRRKQAEAEKHRSEELFSQEDFKDQNIRLTRKINAAQQEIIKLQKEKQSIQEENENFLPWLLSAAEFAEEKNLNRTILATLVHHIDVYEDGKITIYFRYGEEIEELLARAKGKAKRRTQQFIPKSRNHTNIQTVIFEGRCFV